MINIDEVVFDAIRHLQDKDADEEAIDEYTNVILNKFQKLLDRPLLSEEEINTVNHRIKRRMQYKIEISHTVLKKAEHKLWFKQWKTQNDLKYWNRYKKFLEHDKKYTKKVINSVDYVVDDLIDLVGDPSVEGGYDRRGLCIGDVQSGKTSNFIGVMCKAVDVGYKLIVVLAGTSNTLRSQTQYRVDEGLIGSNSEKLLGKQKQANNLNVGFEKMGVSKYSDEIFSPICVTTYTKDFNKNIANQLGLRLDQAKDAIVLVVKKNVSVLNNLNSWIKELNQAEGDGKINNSVLVIDDEADYASINTRVEDADPTKTNALIVELLSLFRKTSYLGFTATPYANVFINPNSDEEMKTNNLFPRDYIYCLDAPSNYIGARNIFGDDSSDMLKTIESEYEGNEFDSTKIYNILPIKHKKDADFEELPTSLKTAIHEFFIINAIRDLRGEVCTHRTMLINISVFVNVHEKIKKTVEEYINSLINSVIYCGKLEDSFNDSNMEELKKVYNHDFAKNNESKEFVEENAYPLLSWKMVKQKLAESVAGIVVRVVNQKSVDDMDYSKHEEGLRVIAIGGIALSRGLTLEGLTISYFHRKSSAYDTLMQMGRWFGYREGYRDLCKIWMTDETQEGFISINRATEELRNSIKDYKNSGLTPMDFGIRVRTDENILITSRNKMRSAKEEIVECSLSSKVIETPYVYVNEAKSINNHKIAVQFIKNLHLNEDVHKIKINNDKIGFKKVQYQNIIDFMENLNIPVANIQFQNNALKNFIIENSNVLEQWDVAIIQGNGKEFEVDENISIKPVIRQVDIKPGTDLIRFSGNKVRLGAPRDCMFDLQKDVIDEIKNSKDKKHLTQNDYFSRGIKRRPLLSIYFVTCKQISREDEYRSEQIIAKEKKFCDFTKDTPIVGISIGIPNLGSKEKYVLYAINSIGQGLSEMKIDLETEDSHDDIQ